ncbi:nucleosome assembly protein 1-like 1 isoform X2 [Colias croceus]|uniref:nucleosome assembly protein 1-like 1 isoform X2 n=1 Tax=Colias crocea TaxID=72248 RepID=UPI001E281756|nr:nucleosome assembly protein 1-like 1 isoform X2 [Colias croceus]
MGSVKQSKKTRSGRTSSSENESGQEDAILGDDKAFQSLTNMFTSMAFKNMVALSPKVRRRINALRVLQKEFIEIESKFYAEVHELECKYAKLYEPLFEKRAQVVNGTYEPTEEECHIPWHDDLEENLAEAVQSTGLTDKETPEIKAKEPAEDMDANVKGIPDFYLTIFKNVIMLGDMVQEHDEPILRCLQDIKVQMHDDTLGFTLEFHFAPNEYFTNTILTKQYSLKLVPDEDDPLKFEGPEIYACKGCEIDWKAGKNVTIKTIKKKQKHKSRGSVRTVKKTVPTDSFFNFFATKSEDPDSTVDANTQTLLALDFQMGHYIRERVVSRAVLLYTGEGLEDDEDFEEEEEEEDEEDDEDEDGEADPNADVAGCKQQ